MTTINISRVTKAEELFSFTFMVDLVCAEPEAERAKLIAEAKKKADELGVGEKFRKELNSMLEIRQKEEKQASGDVFNGESTHIDYDKSGTVRKTIENFAVIMRTDENLQTLRYNELTGRPEFEGKAWNDFSRSKVINYIENVYGIKSENDFDHALNIVCQTRSYHPVRDKIKSIVWDGKERIPYFLKKVMGCNDDEYTEECSRLIFHCGISRIFRPGCKADDIIVLQGVQGNGKSTITQWLAMDESWYGRISDIKGNIGMEQVQGKWICEISELLALSGKNEIEEVKQYFDRKSDNYRRPYARYSDEIPRQCIFIGTTNLREPFKDKTGNRRFYPVWCHIKPGELYKHEGAIKKYIEQCWAEAYYLLGEGKIRPAVKNEMLYIVKHQQDKALEADWRQGLIEEFLKNKTETCVLEIWTEALKMYDKPPRRDSIQIGLILDNLEGWERGENVKNIKSYVKQRFWYKKETVEIQRIDDEFIELIEIDP